MAADDILRSVKFPFGIAGVDLGEVERRIPADEPPPLAPNAALALIGKPVARYNGRAKVTGAARFTVDVALPGMLHGAILRSPLPHARVRAIDIAAAARHPGVRAATRRKASRRPRWWSRANTAPRSRPTAAWSRMRSSQTGAPTA